ncbi:formate/nitrite transporter family protein [Peribacillus deserti]|uniref:Formate/nitrite transporter n=1 Tax=Peribacillus deserti TaxID=673318 RepID=A0A2N5M4N8_9BACI|nr:formate/nitrite transporter family protein [Peribacillus deserti]PLT29328.1 formate/nitrite transporter [Peribacillus deserti]
MAYHPPRKIAEIAISAGVTKAALNLKSMLVLGFLGGAFISLGFLLDIRVSADLPKDWGTFGGFLGAAVFPLGLILIILAGGELLTGNMMAVPFAYFVKRISLGSLVKNWTIITIANFIGAVFVAYFFGHVVGLTAEGAFLAKTVSIADHKIHDDFVGSMVSAIGCNWLVGLAVWLAYGAEDMSGKILGIWFPIMGFVAIGFQHVVANMFIIPAAIFEGHATWAEFIHNFIPVFIGNAIGGSVFVSMAYYLSYKNDLTQTEKG